MVYHHSHHHWCALTNLLVPVYKCGHGPVYPWSGVPFCPIRTHKKKGRLLLYIQQMRGFFCTITSNTRCLLNLHSIKFVYYNKDFITLLTIDSRPSKYVFSSNLLVCRYFYIRNIGESTIPRVEKLFMFKARWRNWELAEIYNGWANLANEAVLSHLIKEVTRLQKLHIIKRKVCLFFTL